MPKTANSWGAAVKRLRENGPAPHVLPFQVVINGPPRTKKNHGRLVRAGRFHRMLPSEAYEEWDGIAAPQLKRAFGTCGPITANVNCRAIFLRHANVGDAVGFYQALADTLEKAGVLVNDRQIVSWDGSRVLKDAANPRVIVTLEAAE